MAEVKSVQISREITKFPQTMLEDKGLIILAGILQLALVFIFKIRWWAGLIGFVVYLLFKMTDWLKPRVREVYRI